jgi:hypothetical protein
MSNSDQFGTVSQALLTLLTAQNNFPCGGDSCIARRFSTATILETSKQSFIRFIEHFLSINMLIFKIFLRWPGEYHKYARTTSVLISVPFINMVQCLGTL